MMPGRQEGPGNLRTRATARLVPGHAPWPTRTAPTPPPAASPPALDLAGRVGAVAAQQLLPSNRRALTPEVLAKTEAEYFREYARLHGLERRRPTILAKGDRAPRPRRPPWRRRGASGRGSRARAAARRARTRPGPGTWDVAVLNEARAALERARLPGDRVLGDFVDAERAMRDHRWSEEEGRAALEQAHGPGDGRGA